MPTWVTTAIEIKHMKSQIQLQHPKNAASMFLRKPHKLPVLIKHPSVPPKPGLLISAQSLTHEINLFFLSLRPHKLPSPIQAYSSFLSHLRWFELGEFRLSRGIDTVGDPASPFDAFCLPARRLNERPFSLQRLYNANIFLAVQVDFSVQDSPVLFCEMKQNDHSLFD